jgi:hypothetical protein
MSKITATSKANQVSYHFQFGPAVKRMREASGEAGGGKFGNYIQCSFSVKGVGRFKPVDGANPAIGTVGSTEEVIEERIEISCEDESLSKVISIIQEVHPYEEPVIDIYKLENK